MAQPDAPLHAGPQVNVQRPAACPVHEEPLKLDCEGHTLWGILSLPQPAAAPRTGVVVIVGGPQYRVGSHRQFVQLARRLAADGHAVLRFDVRGMGDSEGQALPNFEHMDADIAAALEGLRQRLPGLQATVLWGLCDGASAALMYVQRNPHAPLAGLCLANPWVRSAATQAQTTVKHYYKDRLKQRAFWLKLLKGGVAVKAVRDLITNLLQARQPKGPTQKSGSSAQAAMAMPFQSRMAQGWLSFGKPVLLLLSENDYTAKEFLEVARNDPAWKGALHCKGVTTAELLGTDHTCSDAAGRVQLEEATARWLATAPLNPAHGEARK